jgi:hypothetical protein
MDAAFNSGAPSHLKNVYSISGIVVDRRARSSGFFLKKKTPFTALEEPTHIPEMP